MTVKKPKTKKRPANPREWRETLFRRLVTSEIDEQVLDIAAKARAEIVDAICDQLLEPMLMLVENQVTLFTQDEDEDEIEDEDEDEDEDEGGDE
jgi:vacuolar-type H+-ATPase subunit C/Vma6